MNVSRLLSFIMLLVLQLPSYANESYRVLVLHSYHAGLAWSDSIQRGIDEAVKESGLDVMLHIEHFDSLRFRDRLPALKSDLRQVLQTKFATRPPSAILVSDNDAFDFILAERGSIAPGVPVIFCGINGLGAYAVDGMTGVTGVAEDASFGDTLASMERLFPGRSILVVGDRSETFRRNLDTLRQANQLRTVPFAIDVVDDPALARIETRLRELGKDKLVFFMARPVDADGKPVSIPRALTSVAAASPQPIFSGWDFMLGHGIVGGKLVSGEDQGRTAGRQLARILRGTPVSAVPVLHESPNRYFFDYRQLTRFGVENIELPEGSTVINRPVSFFEANREKVIGVAVAFGLLLIVIALLIAEIMRRIAAEKKLGHASTHDALTNLANRSQLRDRFRQARALAERNNRSIACLSLDLDHFKDINDSLGHTLGDLLLKDVATRISGHVREADTVCRIGGDEFVILLPDLERAEDAAVTAQKIVGVMQSPFEVAGNMLTISISIGVSTFPWDGQDDESLLRNASMAMYQAKRAGRNDYCFFNESMNVGVQRRLRLHQHLVGAQLRGEMRLYLQPQMSLSDETIVGAEALLRWQSPELGSVSPAEFIPVAESSGLIVQIGTWVLDEACRIIAAWQADGHPPIPLAVNVSVTQLRRPDFVEHVQEILLRHAVAPTRLEIEFTESVFMEDAPAIAANIAALESMGVLLAIDDFGTGYSNLSYLKKIAADRLKIDQSFIRGILGDTNDAEIVRAVVKIGHSLGLKTIAEGVEERAQADFLASLGCDSMQGWLLSPAVPEAEFTRFFTSYPARHQLRVIEGTRSDESHEGLGKLQQRGE